MMVNIEIDFVTTPVGSDQTPAGHTDINIPVTWPEDRWLLGWGPWVGWGKGSVGEGHLALLITGPDGGFLPLFMRGPHKESNAVMYDLAACCDFFPSGYARFVKAGEQLILQLHYSNLGTDPFGIQGSARLFTVKA